MLPSFIEWIVVASIVILVFNARRLPEIARAARDSITGLKKGLNEDAENPPPKDVTPSKKE